MTSLLAIPNTKSVSSASFKVPDTVDLDDVNSSDVSFLNALTKVKPDAAGSIRGVKEAQIYKRVSPSVVLIATNTGLGSGSLLNNNGDVLTNWHVIAGAKEIGVIFKPSQEGKNIANADVRRARIVKIDQVSDLALLRLESVPQNASPVSFASMDDIMVGADVHAIGHPTGEAWTYTKGVVSQIRQDYKWTSEDKKAHNASVIQTQTPINPGNSGGPLLTDDGKLVGVNSFKSKGEGLNFAVSVDDVRRFLSSNENRLAKEIPQENKKKQQKCGDEARELYSGPNKEKTGSISVYDTNCDGKPDFDITLPYDTSKDAYWRFDTNGDGKYDQLYFDPTRKGYFEFSLHDINYDGKWDMVGFHEAGKIKPVRYELYEVFTARR